MGIDVASVVEKVFPAALAEQVEKGQKKYGVRLTTFNGRDAYKDAVEEMIDTFQYVTQIDFERVVVAQLLVFYGAKYDFWDSIENDVRITIVKIVGGEEVFNKIWENAKNGEGSN